MLGLGRVLDIETSYSREYIVSVLTENRAKHVEDYKKAMIVYRKDVEDRLEALKKVVTKKLKSDVINHIHSDEVERAYMKWSNIKEPVDATKMYDQYINLFSKSVSPEITLTMGDANAIINDEWDWAVSAKMTNSFYSTRSV